MQPSELSAESFSQYSPKAKALAIANLDLMRRTPLALLGAILRQAIEYDWRFPAEQRELDGNFHSLRSMSPAEFESLMSPFAALKLPPGLAQQDWVNEPKRFTEDMSGMLWSSSQIDAFHRASERYQQMVLDKVTSAAPAIPRLTITVIGQGYEGKPTPVFQRLKQHGTLFTNVDPENGLQTLFDAVNRRASQHVERYAHWYLDGGASNPVCSEAQGVTATSFAKLAPVALHELNLVDQYVRGSVGGSVGAEAVTTYMSDMKPEDLWPDSKHEDPVLERFELSLLTEGSGTQVFSTTFVQWASRQSLLRAQPLTLLARFAPRQRVAPMDALLKRDPLTQPIDAAGSLIDADMAAYYNWINQSRLSGADQAKFLAWFEGQRIAVAMAPTLPRGTVSTAATSLQKILEWMD